jgi:predicted Fe-Mo cluster-binding NifX family protein
MKIAISATGKTMDSLLDLRFGRCKYFLIYDTESKKVNAIENKGMSSAGGAGIAAAQQLIDENIDVIITGDLGPNAFELINKTAIKVYKGKDISIESVLEEYNKNQFSELNESGPAHHGMGK